MLLGITLRRVARGVAAVAALAIVDGALGEDNAKPLPERYVVDYPAAESFCAPLASYWDDVSSTLQSLEETDGNLIRHPLNGGYGLPIVDKVDGKNLLHLGCDVGWQRPNAPVYSVANGVVRISDGPALVGDAEKSKKPSDAAKARPKPGNFANRWGNLIVIEHHLSDGSYVTTVYGHLSSRRFVSVGDVVEAGQVIGTVGRPGLENGGYKAHLHFAVREGRMAEPGSVLLSPRAGGAPTSIKLVELGEKEIEVKTDKALPAPFALHVADREFAMTERDGKTYLPASILHFNFRPEWTISGYALSTKGWLDPTELLAKMKANRTAAAYGAMPKLPKRKP